MRAEDSVPAFRLVMGAVIVYKGEAKLQTIRDYLCQYLNPSDVPSQGISKYVKEALERGITLGFFKYKCGKYRMAMRPSCRPPPKPAGGAKGPPRCCPPPPSCRRACPPPCPPACPPACSDDCPPVPSCSSVSPVLYQRERPPSVSRNHLDYEDAVNWEICNAANEEYDDDDSWAWWPLIQDFGHGITSILPPNCESLEAENIDDQEQNPSCSNSKVSKHSDVRSKRPFRSSSMHEF